MLVLRALGLGDFLTGVPALRALRRAYPAESHEIVLACPESLAPLASLASGDSRGHEDSGGTVVDRLLPARGLEPLDWDGPPPAVAVNLHGKGPQSHELLQALSPRRLVAFACPAAGHDGAQWRADEHEVRRWCRLVEESLGVPADPADLLLARPGAVPGRTGAVVVHPGAAYPSRRWPADRFGEVARRLAAEGHSVVVTGGPEEVALARQVAAAAGLPLEVVLAGRTDLSELAAMVASARLVVCGDTGVAHLATAFGTPSVVMFGPVSPAVWGPVTGGPHTVIWHGEGSGDPWGEEVDPALMKVEVDEVIEAAEALLDPA